MSKYHKLILIAFFIITGLSSASFVSAESAPTVSGINPVSGSPSGGTSVTISGSNFSIGLDSYTKLLLHSDGANNSTTFTDSASSPKTMTANGNAKISTAQSKFGGSSAVFDGNGDFVSTPDSADWDLGSGDFTIDYWIRYPATPNYTAVLGQWNGATSQKSWLLEHIGTAAMGFYYSTTGSDQSSVSFAWTPSVDTWYHCAMVRSGTNMLFFVNGTQVGTAQSIGAATFFNSSDQFQIGQQEANTGTSVNAYIDEVRVSKGIARWTANFTSPSVRYGTPAVTIGGTAATSVASTDGSTITAVTPAHALGAGNVVATNPDTQSATLTNGYTYFVSNVYYSVGQSAADLKTGTPNVAITSGVATFTVAQTGNIGVGDVIVANAISYYISSKTSTTVWNVVTNTGATPTNIGSTAVTSIKHVYTSLNSAVAGAATLLGNSDLTAANVALNIPCYYDSAADTTAVTVSGYTTDATRYIKIYTPSNTATESNNSQRAMGKWDAGKYSLVSSGTTTVQLNSAYIIFEGIQLKNTNATASADTAIIYTSLNNASSLLTINKNILVAQVSGVNTMYAFKDIYQTVKNVILSNNVFYNITGGSAEDRAIVMEGGNFYVYNNTVYNAEVGFKIVSTSTVVAKNNIVQGATDGYYGTFDAASDYNISNLSSDTTGGAHDKQATVNFVSTVSGLEDFHLSPADSAAKNSGADLSADANFAFSTDIDGASRNAAINAWDIGADETATEVYFSVGQNTSDHKTSTPTVTVSGTTATFSVAQTATNMGVGDLVTYIGGTCYLSAKTNADQMHWNCVSATGGQPAQVAGVSVTSIAHAFGALEGTVDANTGNGAFDASHLNTKNLVTGNYQLNVPCYYDTGADPNTLGVSVRGWTTGGQNSIKIYTPNNTTTEVNQTQRPAGKWDATKYNVAINHSAFALSMLTIRNDAVTVEGLQFYMISTAFEHDAIYAINPNASGAINIASNIIRAELSGTATGFAVISHTNNVGSTNIYNNVIYGFGINGDAGGPEKVYNNTVSGSAVGISGTANDIAKNNIVQNCANGYSGTFNAASDYNISDLAADNAGGAHDKQATVAFADATNKDFHLSPTDTQAKDAGANLSADSNFAFTTDIDSQTRNQNGLGWDIGADEAATQIFYSVGQNTTDHKTGSPTVTVSGSTATFSVAQTATNMGVGDLVTYTGGTCYLSAKTNADQMHWNCVSATGGTPTAASAGTTVTSITHAFASLEGAVDANTATGAFDATHLNTKDLVTNNYQLNIPCYYDTGADTTAVTVQFWTTGAQDYVKIYTPYNTTSEINQTQRHSGKWDDGKYRMVVPMNNFYNDIIYSQIKFVWIDGLQIEKAEGVGFDSGGMWIENNFSDGGVIRISNNIVRNTNTTGTIIYGISALDYSSNFATTYYVWSNIIYGFNNSDSYGIYLNYLSVDTDYVYNNTIYNNTIGINNENGGGTVFAKNNLAYNNTTDYAGTFNASSTNNLSKDATSPNAGGADCGGHSCRNQTVSFVSTTTGAEDFHLAPSDTAAKNSGADLSADANFPFNTDIDGETRHAGVWDIGADENNSINVQLNRNVQLKRNVQIK